MNDNPEELSVPLDLDWCDVEIDLRCPKCNGDPSADIFVRGQDRTLDRFVIRCDDDQGCGYMTDFYKTIREAIEAWNKRA